MSVVTLAKHCGLLPSTRLGNVADRTFTEAERRSGPPRPQGRLKAHRVSSCCADKDEVFVYATARAHSSGRSRPTLHPQPNCDAFLSIIETRLNKPRRRSLS